MLRGKKINLLGNTIAPTHDINDALVKFLLEVVSKVKSHSQFKPEFYSFVDSIEKVAEEKRFSDPSLSLNDILVFKEFFNYIHSIKNELNPDNPFDEKYHLLEAQVDEISTDLCQAFTYINQPSDLDIISKFLGVAPQINSKGNVHSTNGHVQLHLPDGIINELFSGKLGEQPIEKTFTIPPTTTSNKAESPTPAIELNLSHPFSLGFQLHDLFSSHHLIPMVESSLAINNMSDELTVVEAEIDQLQNNVTELIEDGELNPQLLDEATDILSEDEVIADDFLSTTEAVDDILQVEPSFEEQHANPVELNELIGGDDDIIGAESLSEVEEPSNLQWIIGLILKEWKKDFSSFEYYSFISEGLVHLMQSPNPISSFKDVSMDSEYLEFVEFLESSDSNKNLNRDFVLNQLQPIAERAYHVFDKVFRQQTQDASDELGGSGDEFNENSKIPITSESMDAELAISDDLVDDVVDDFLVTDDAVVEPDQPEVIEDFGSDIIEDDIEEVLEEEPLDIASELIDDEELVVDETDPLSTEFVEGVTFDDQNLSLNDDTQAEEIIEQDTQHIFDDLRNDENSSSLQLVDDTNVTIPDEIISEEIGTEQSSYPNEYFTAIQLIYQDVKKLNSVGENSLNINQFIDFSLSLRDPVETLRDHMNIAEVKEFVEFIDVLHHNWTKSDYSAYQPLYEHQTAIADQIYTILSNYKEIVGDTEPSATDNNLRLVTPSRTFENADLDFNENIDPIETNQISEDLLTTEDEILEEPILTVDDQLIEESNNNELLMGDEEIVLDDSNLSEPLIEEEAPISDGFDELSDLPDELPTEISENFLDELPTELVDTPDTLDDFGLEEPEKPKAPTPAIESKAETARQKQELNEVQKIFLLEAEENIQKISNDLLELERDLGSHGLIDSILRSAHTLKGSAAMMKFTHMSKLGHKMEDVFQILRDEKIPADRDLIDIMLKGTDLQTNMLNMLRSDGHDDVEGLEQAGFELEEYKKKLEAKMAGGAYQPVKFEPSEKSEAIEKSKPTTDIERGGEQRPTQQNQGRPIVAEQTLRIDIATLNSLINLAAELLISRNRMTNQLGSMEGIMLKLQREKGLLSTILKKVIHLAGRSENDDDMLGAIDQEILQDFADTEFDRFSEYDVIIRDMKGNISNFDDLSREIRNLGDAFRQSILGVSGIANELNTEIMGMRMVPVKHMFIRFQRSIRDIGREESKDVDLKVEGEDTRLDKTVMEEVIEPIMHCVRNAVSHGIELPEVRVSKNKPEQGLIVLRAYQDGAQVVLEVEDDGAGIDPEKLKSVAIKKGLISPEKAAKMNDNEAMELMFVPGFSTAEKVTSLSGRGVGMDVVKNVINKFKGSISIKSKIGKGSTFLIRLPLTLAINQSLLIEVGSKKYAFPLNAVEETLELVMENIKRIGDQELISLRDETIPLLHLTQILGVQEDVNTMKAKYPVVILSDGDQKIAVRVDKLMGKEEIVVKNLGTHLKNVMGVVGATVLGDGTVILILDVGYLFNFWQGGNSAGRSSIRSEVFDRSLEEDSTSDASMGIVEPIKQISAPRIRPKGKIRILCADDSVSIRKYVESLLKREEFEVTTAPDGSEAYDLAEKNSYDLIMTDLEMPKMHGYELISALRSKQQFSHIPIVILTARSGEKHRRRGLELGANAFLNKPFDVDELLNTIHGLIQK